MAVYITLVDTHTQNKYDGSNKSQAPASLHSTLQTIAWKGPSEGS